MLAISPYRSQFPGIFRPVAAAAGRCYSSRVYRVFQRTVVSLLLLFSFVSSSTLSPPSTHHQSRLQSRPFAHRSLQKARRFFVVFEPSSSSSSSPLSAPPPTPPSLGSGCCGVHRKAAGFFFRLFFLIFFLKNFGGVTKKRERDLSQQQHTTEKKKKKKRGREREGTKNQKL